MGKATIPVRQDSKESEPLKNPKMVIRTYAYNIGYSAGSFIFIGFATKDTLEKIKNFNPHNFGNDPILQFIDLAVQLMLVPEREFEKVDSRGVSKPIDYDISLLKKNFDEGSIIYSVYMDPLGKYIIVNRQ